MNPKIVGEWSLAFNNKGDNFLPMAGNHSSTYYKWFSAQQTKYEQLNGWIFWTWKTDKNLPNIEQWNYQSKYSQIPRATETSMLTSLKEAVEAGIIDKDLNAQYNKSPC